MGTPNENPQDFVLASASPRRLTLLRQIGIEPARIVPADIDETPRKSELPRDYARRIASEKARFICCHEDMAGSYLLAADTVVACGRRILPKAENVSSSFPGGDTGFSPVSSWSHLAEKSKTGLSLRA